MKIFKHKANRFEGPSFEETNEIYPVSMPDDLSHHRSWQLWPIGQQIKRSFRCQRQFEIVRKRRRNFVV
ncbi:hypothetical protein, partial [uncultured Oscillibacter sp.]|uniref:hypothetical protein n=1 Tax=uncultured Oscillibacter sp. TaxID=876091 RepID=UPI00260169C9